MSAPLRYLLAYPNELIDQVQHLIDKGRLADFLRSKYPDKHAVYNDRMLRDYTMDIKNRYLKKSAPLSNVLFDQKIHVINNALGIHSYRTQVQGSKLKTKNDIRISALFKSGPEDFLNMIVVHELAHLKEKQHNKAFYKLCMHMLPDYHQLEFDVRVYLTHLELLGEVYD